MNGKVQKSSKKGYILIIIGGIMLLGLLNLGFLIPFGIAAFLIYKGWGMVKSSQSHTSMEAALYMDPRFPCKPSFQDADPLDEWEKQVKKNNR